MNKEDKKEFMSELNEETYKTTRVGIRVFIGFAIVAVLCTVSFCGIRYVNANLSREVFKQSTTYNEGVLDDLAKYKYEYSIAKTDTEKKAIKSVVRNRFANYDTTKIKNDELKAFLKECGL